MSVRATERLISDIVTVHGMSNSPKMVAVSVDPEAKTVTTVWFSDSHEAQQAVFPASAIDRVEDAPAPAAKAASGRGRKAKK